MKFGISQIGKKSPESLVKFIDAIIIFIMPAFASFIVSIPPQYLSEPRKTLIGAFATFTIATLKGFQYMIGKIDTDQETK